MNKNNKALLSILLLLTSASMFIAFISPSWMVLAFCAVNVFAFICMTFAYNKSPSMQKSSHFAEENNDMKYEISKSDVKFDHIAGMEEIKEEIAEIADFLINPEKYRKFGAKIPKGVLFYGPPGTGKTMIARALANETDAGFIYASGSEFIEKFVGVGASRIRAIFERAQKKAPCLIFIDEIDAIGVSRNTDNNSERDQTLNQLLIELDGFNQNDGVVVVAATNRLDMLDAALLRPGRFDRHIYIGNPCMNAREKILRVHLKDKPIGPNIDYRRIASKTSGMSGAHIANITNEAALLAIKHNKQQISQEDLEEAIIKVHAGLKNSNMLLSEREKRSISFHESAHALAECYYNKSVPDRITIIPHGKALGFMMVDGGEDKVLLAREDLENKICVLLAGRASEEIEFKELTTGAHNDLQKANELANQMVCEYGMSRFKNRIFDRQTDVFMSKEIHEEISAILDGCYAKVTNMLKENYETLSKLAHLLYENELIRKPEIEEVLCSSLNNLQAAE